MKRSLQSAILAVALMFGTSASITMGHALIAPTAAHAGVLGKIGGAVKNTAKNIGAAAKAGAKGVVYVGKTAGTGVASNVKRAAVAVGKQAAKIPLVQQVRRIAR